jgi:hypothetical protein
MKLETRMTTPLVHPPLARLALLALAGSVLASAGCDPEPTPPACTTCGLENPLNRALVPAFEAAGHTPRFADPRELCARLATDLLGRSITAEDALERCSGRDLEEVILSMQGTTEYLVTSERHWADRFQVNDIGGDWRSIKGLYELIHRLHRSELGYRELAIQAMGHPGLMTSDFEARGRVQRVFRSFMGRPASEGEEAELAALFRAWLIRFDPDPDFPVLYRLTPIILTGLCDPLARCSTSLYGGAALEFPGGADFVGVDWERADESLRAVLRVPGELLTAQPTFFEAAADEILDRILDWDEGERAIRTPGHLFPEVRQVLADFLRDTGDYPAAERLVYTSWLYTQPVDVTDGVTLAGSAEGDEPSPLLTGPTKPVSGETWLAGVAHLTTFELGTCDARYGDGFQFFLLLDAYQQGLISLAEHNASVELLHELREDRNRLLEFEGVLYYDYQFITLARMLGGCPGFQASRQRPVGVSYALLQEGIAQAFCAPEVANLAVPGGDATPRRVMEHLVPRLLSRPATDDDVRALELATGCPGAASGCTRAELVSQACTALLGSAEYLFR